jgi:hypothetical protein
VFRTAASPLNAWRLARRGKFGHSHDLVAAAAERRKDALKYGHRPFLVSRSVVEDDHAAGAYGAETGRNSNA